MAARPEAFRAPFTQLEETSHDSAWWSIALRGLAAVVFGVIAISKPSVAAGAFVIIFAIYALFDGAVAFVQAALRGRAGLRWGWFLVEGIASVAIGIIALAYPTATLLAVVLLVAVRAIVLGIVELIGAFSGRGVDSSWLLGVTGVVSTVFGVLLLANPFAGGLVLLWTIGVYAIIFGVMLLGHAVHVLGQQHRGARLHGPAATAT